MKNGEAKNLRRVGQRWLADFSERDTDQPKKPDGHYHCRRRRIQFDSREAALIYLNRRRERRLLGHLGIKQDDQPVEIQPVEAQAESFESFSRRFLELRSNLLRANTMRCYRTIQKALLPTFGHRRLADITAEDLESWKARRLSEIKASSVNREVTFLRTLFRKGVEFGRINRDPSAGLRLNREAETRVHVLSRAELGRMIECAAPHLRPLLTVLAATGLRKNEALQLRWIYRGWDANDKPESILDLAGLRIVVKATLAKAHKERTVPLAPELAAMLKDLVMRPGERVFPFDSFKRSFHTAAKEAGLAGLKVHWLRHTAASVMVNELGADLLTAMQILGHADVNTTMRYLHKSDANVKKATAAMAGWVSGGRPLDDTDKIKEPSERQLSQ